jgi:hypothetical protein
MGTGAKDTFGSRGHLLKVAAKHPKVLKELAA